VSGLALYFEDEGLATVSIALVKEHAIRMKPPRALWVPYPLGRPFGAPNDVELQKRIILSALELLKSDSGPVLEDFPDVPAAVEEDESSQSAWLCPVSFPAPRADPGDRLTPVIDEIRALAPWYERAVEHRGRTTLGLSGRSLDDAVNLLVGYSEEGGAEPEESIAALIDAIRWSADDVKAYYFEAASGQSDSVAPSEFEQWFWNETEAAKLLQAVRLRCLAHDDAAIRDVGDFMLVPDAFR
jgi:hypothetical protein